ncbi:hypothetical protein V2J09_013598 [Rumex salicifolius]
MAMLAKAFNTIFSKLGITSNIKWNTTEDPCSGVAVEDSITIDDTSHNPFIKCDCSFDNGTTCHITALKVSRLDVVGQIPDELWTLTYISNLQLDRNYLTGSISPSIGNLTKMQWLTFGYNLLSGNLPKEIGKLTRLMSFYIDSAGFSGEIPPSFSNLVNMHTMWMSDVEFNGSIPEFIGNWTQLVDLRLEGNSFVGSIPSSFSNLTVLETLRIGDLSNGTSSLAFITNLTSLTTLVLRNIHFSDSIPTDIGGLSNLNYLDLSFNKISGKIPDSLFSLGSLNFLFLGNNKLTGTLPSQKSSSLTNIDVSYNQLSGTIPSWISSNMQLFAVNCGGPQIKAFDGTVFEKEDEGLGPATYYVADTKRWGVSNAGQFLANNNVSFTASSSSQFSNTLDSELFQKARLSPGSLRYYGLGLENGNYTILLQFTELIIQNGKTWKSLGRRVFDIYIQADGGVSYSVVKKSFNATVTSNHLEVHLLWVGKGTCCIPVQGTYGPSISAISITPNFVPTVSNEPPSNNNKTGLILAIALPVVCVCLLLLAVCYLIIKKKRLRAAQEEELLGLEAKPYIFSYSELKSATEDFHASHKIGEGGFGPVYKGKLNDGRDVAVKQLAFKSPHGKRQFVAEIETISSVQHRNLVKLHGCSIEGDKRLLVYEYLVNGSLERALFGKGGFCLSWAKRFEICLGVAKGLSYLHQEANLKIVHRDVKASNVLLDSGLTPKISDFGLAKLYNEKDTHITTGTWQLYESNREVDLIDEKLEGKFDEEEVKRVIRIGLLCTQTAHTQRPPMSRVVAMLFGDVEVGDVPAKPGYLSEWRYDDANFQSTTISSYNGAYTTTSSATTTMTLEAR